MRPSQQLSHEHRFLVAAERCLERLAGDPQREGLREDLADIVAFKRERLPLLAWNATLGSSALASAYALDVPALAPAQAELAGQTETEMVLLLAGRLPLLGRDGIDMRTWDEPWEALERSAFPGRLRRSEQLLTTQLTAVAQLIEKRQEIRPLCPQGRPTRDAEILLNVFRGYYAESVQPYLVAVHGAQRRWTAALEALNAAQGVAPPEGFASFAAEALDPAGSAARAFVAARERHTAAWQSVLDSCGMSPAG